jgi:hypothetical protein
MQRRAFTAGLVLGVGSGLTGAARAQARPTLAVAVNRTARMRGLAFRASKAYLQVHLQVLSGAAEDLIAAVERDFSLSLETAGRVLGNGQAAEQHQRLQELRGSLVAAMVRPTNRNAVVNVVNLSESIYTAANALLQSLTSRLSTPTASLIPTAGMLRNRAQRIARNYLYMAAGGEGAGLRTQIAADRTEFLRALDSLTRAPLSTPIIRSELELVRSQWVFMEAAIATSPTAETMRNVCTTSERVYTVAESLSALYEDALRELLGR